MWFFAQQHGDGSMRRLAASRVTAFQQGAARLDASAPGELRMVQVGLVVDRRQVVQFIDAWCPRYRLTADDTLDLAHQWEGMRLAMGMIDLLPSVEAGGRFSVRTSPGGSMGCTIAGVRTTHCSKRWRMPSTTRRAGLPSWS